MTSQLELAPAALNEQQLLTWREDGYLVLRQFFSAEEIAAAGAEADELLERRRDLIDVRNLRCRFQRNAGRL